MSEQLKWQNKEAEELADYDPTTWIYREYTKGQWLNGALCNLFAHDHILSYPMEISWCLGSAVIGDHHEIDQEQFHPYSERLWAIWKDNQGAIWSGCANPTNQEWEQLKQVVFVPSGSSNAHICFDKEARIVYVVDLIPPELLKSEIWLIEPPYTEGMIRFICYGKRPKLFMDHTKDLILFYHDDLSTPGNTKICYRCQSEAWEIEHTVPIMVGGKKNVKSLQYFYFGTPELPEYNMAALLAFTVAEERIIRYLQTEVLAHQPLELLKSLTDKYQGQVDLLGFTWINVIPSNETKMVAETYQSFTKLQKIEWQEQQSNTIIVATQTESYQSYAGVRKIEWKELIKVRSTHRERYNGYTKVNSLLWIKI